MVAILSSYMDRFELLVTSLHALYTLDHSSVLVQHLEDLEASLLGRQEGGRRPKVALVILPGIQVNLCVPWVVGFPILLGLVIQKDVNNVEEALLGRDVKAGGALVGRHVAYSILAELGHYRTVVVDAGVVQCIESLMILDFHVCALVPKNDL